MSIETIVFLLPLFFVATLFLFRKKIKWRWWDYIAILYGLASFLVFNTLKNAMGIGEPGSLSNLVVEGLVIGPILFLAVLYLRIYFATRRSDRALSKQWMLYLIPVIIMLLLRFTLPYWPE